MILPVKFTHDNGDVRLFDTSSWFGQDAHVSETQWLNEGIGSPTDTPLVSFRCLSRYSLVNDDFDSTSRPILDAIGQKIAETNKHVKQYVPTNGNDSLSFHCNEGSDIKQFRKEQQEIGCLFGVIIQKDSIETFNAIDLFRLLSDSKEIRDKRANFDQNSIRCHVSQRFMEAHKDKITIKQIANAACDRFPRLGDPSLDSNMISFCIKLGFTKDHILTEINACNDGRRYIVF